MCLDRVDGKPSKTFGFGWKVFGTKNGKLYSQIFHIGISRPVNKWLQSTSDKVESESDKSLYQSGFHVFTSRGDAELWLQQYLPIGPYSKLVIRRVRYRKAHTAGIQNEGIGFMPVIVASEIKILPLKKVVDKRKTA